MKMTGPLRSILHRFIWPALLIIVSLGVLGAFWQVANAGSYTNLESYFLQISVALVGIAASFYSGRLSVREAGREIIKPHARSAFRRLVSLYRSISEVGRIIERSRNSESLDHYKVILAELKGIVFWQLVTADDALEDWKDIVPEEVQELDRKLSADDATEERR